MKARILNFIRRVGLFLNIHIHLSSLTTEKELKEFLKSLFPVKIDKELIRVGARADGGYIIPDDLEGVDALFSPGVGSKQDFDFECAHNGMKVFMADASVDGPINHHDNFVFTKKFIGALDNEEYMSIEEWVKSSDLSGNSDLILQMDIEGYEYETIFSIPNDIMKRFRIVIIEFHQLEMLWNKFYFDRFKNVFNKLLQTHYVVHIHPNNCCKPITKGTISIPPVLEFTFIRKDRVSTQGYITDFPHKLDVDCANKETLVLPSCWYKN